MEIVIWIVVVIVVILVTWWIFNVERINGSPPKQKTYADFIEMYDNFYRKPKSLWMSNSRSRLDASLRDSPYHYIILDSLGRIIYNNRSCYGEDSESTAPISDNNLHLVDSFEVTGAIVLGEASVLRENTRNVAIRVNDGPIYRIVHISSPNVSIGTALTAEELSNITGFGPN